LEIDNNLVENAIRPVALGRKNYLFAGSHEGAKRAAMIYTLVAIARLHQVEPFAYLNDILKRLPDHPINKIAELLPQNWRTPYFLERAWSPSKDGFADGFSFSDQFIPYGSFTSYAEIQLGRQRYLLSEKILPNQSVLVGITILHQFPAGLYQSGRRKSFQISLVVRPESRWVHRVDTLLLREEVSWRSLEVGC